jgi:hypothetical protein
VAQPLGCELKTGDVVERELCSERLDFVIEAE